MTHGTVLEIYTAPDAGAPMRSHTEIVAIAGRGLAGDRYTLGRGFYTATPITQGGRELTMIDLAAIEAVAEQTGMPLTTRESRRNLITTGFDLDAAIGMAFRIGEVLCEGVRPCPPCVHLDELTGKRVMPALVRTGGLRARIVEGGIIRTGDPISIVGPATGPSVRDDG